MVKPGQNMNGLKWDIVIFWQLYTNTVRMATRLNYFNGRYTLTLDTGGVLCGTLFLLGTPSSSQFGTF